MTYFLIGIVIFMLSLAFASVPIYRAFCQTTGFAGTPRIAKMSELPSKKLERTIKVRFTATVNHDLPWEFKTLQLEKTVKLGQVGLAFYHAKNKASHSITGMATYNVSPEKAGQYFNKVACFCFEQQLLQPGMEMDMPVQFFIDPELDNDPVLDDVKEITLSYTFFWYRDQKDLERNNPNIMKPST